MTRHEHSHEVALADLDRVAGRDRNPFSPRKIPHELSQLRNPRGVLWIIDRNHIRLGPLPDVEHREQACDMVGMGVGQKNPVDAVDRVSQLRGNSFTCIQKEAILRRVYEGGVEAFANNSQFHFWEDTESGYF